MGLSGVGANYLDAIATDVRLDLVAVADVDPGVLQHCPIPQGVRVYDDYRSLVVETANTGLDLLVVAEEPFASREFVDIAGRRGIAVFHKTPPARTVRELERLLEGFAQSRSTLTVARRRPFDPTPVPRAQLDALIGPIHLAAADISTTHTPTGWRGDSTRAGGGVLLNGAYEAADLLVHLLGLPETVYAQCTAQAPPGGTPNYDTEDVAVLSLRFGRHRVAALTARRGALESHWCITVTGARADAIISDTEVLVVSRDAGQTVIAPVRAANPDQPLLSAWVDCCVCDEPNVTPPTVGEHLNTLAVIEAAYLSAETGVPESPRQLLGLETV